LGLELAEEGGEDFDGPDDVGDGAAAGEVGNDVVEALEDGAGDSEAGELLEGFVDEVAGVEVGGDEDVGLTGDLVGFGAHGGLAFVEADAGINGGVKLHFSGDEEVALVESS